MDIGPTRSHELRGSARAKQEEEETLGLAEAGDRLKMVRGWNCRGNLECPWELEPESKIEFGSLVLGAGWQVFISLF